MLSVPPAAAFAGTVTVQPGQTLSQVATEEHTTVAALAAANGISQPDLVVAGTVLQVPVPGPDRAGHRCRAGGHRRHGAAR